MDTAPRITKGQETPQNPERIAEAAIEKLADIRTRVREALTQNPYRAAAILGYNGTAGMEFERRIRSESYLTYNHAIESIDAVLRTGETNDALMQVRGALVNESQAIDAVAAEVHGAIVAQEERIKTSPLNSEMHGPSGEVSKKLMVTMNRETAGEENLTLWDDASLAGLSVEEMKAYMNEHGSGRYFLHGFPEISIEKGYITNAVGGEALLGGFEISRDRAQKINFTVEDRESPQEQFYLQFSSGFTGGVLYPAETLLTNYAFTMLPYYEDLKRATSEWRLIGPHDNPTSPLHMVPLSLGVCFFAADVEDQVRAHIAGLPEHLRPKRIIFHKDGKNAGLREFIADLKAPNGLPHMARTVDRIGTEGEGVPVFGTELAKQKYETKLPPKEE